MSFIKYYDKNYGWGNQLGIQHSGTVSTQTHICLNPLILCPRDLARLLLEGKFVRLILPRPHVQSLRSCYSVSPTVLQSFIYSQKIKYKYVYKCIDTVYSESIQIHFQILFKFSFLHHQSEKQDFKRFCKIIKNKN